MLDDSIYVSDIETCLVVDSKTNRRVHLPVMIGFKNVLELKIFKIAVLNLNIDYVTFERASCDLIQTYFEYLDFSSIKNIKVYFHNMANFDGYIMLKALKNQKEKYRVTTITRDNKIYRIDIKNIKLKKNITILDSYLLIPFSLSHSSILFNKKNFKTEYSEKFLKIENLINHDFNALEKYLENDLETTYELLCETNKFFVSEFNSSILTSITLSSLVQKLFIKKYIADFKALTDNQEMFIRKAYVGGIVDVYKPHAFDLIMLDFNNMYPSIMANTLYSLNKPIYIRQVANLQDFCEKNIGFLKCIVKCKQGLKYPLISLKYNNYNMQPTGEFLSVIYTKEILYCLKNYPDYYKFEVCFGYYYEDNTYIFNEFINECFRKKEVYIQKSNKIGVEYIKRILNGFYGRWGIKPEVRNLQIFNLDAAIDIINKSDDIYMVDQIGDDFIIEYSKFAQNAELSRKILKSRVDWAAQTTAEARIKMQALKDLVEVIYTDTDSIVIKREDLKKVQHLVNSKEPGKLKIVGEYEEGIFLNNKGYMLKAKDKYIFKIAGVLRTDISMTDAALYKWFLSKLYIANDNKLKIKQTVDFAKDAKGMEIYAYCRDLELELQYTKRKKVLNEADIWIDTVPKHIIKK